VQDKGSARLRNIVLMLLLSTLRYVMFWG